jgi:sigma-B regulation protein RsbU (phosphoserine phosphatase)
MDQKKLHRTVETIASQKFASEKEMLIEVLNQVIENQDVKITGGRIWMLDKQEGAYYLLYQTGNVERITPDFKLKILEYPVVERIAKERTILGNETNIVLRKKGIFKYSASGVGDKVKVDGKLFYEYLLALNSDVIDEDLRLTLNIISTALTSQIKQKRYSASADQFKANLDKARELQKSILPEHEYRFHNYELFGITNPAEIVGGDFFDYLEIGDDGEKLAVTVGDAASKGVSASAEAMYISGAIRMASSFEIKISPLMKRTNQLVNKIFSDDKFASLFYGELSSDRGGLFLYANAGHNPPFFVKKDSPEIKTLEPTGPVFGPTPFSKYTVGNINFAKGDVLLIYSDGITESTDEKFEPYGENKLLELLQKMKSSSPKEITYSILDDVVKFSKNGSYSDDKTLVVIKRIK